MSTVGDSPVYRLRRGRMKQAGTEQTGLFRRLQAYLGMGPRSPNSCMSSPGRSSPAMS